MTLLSQRNHPSRLAHALPYIEGLEAANPKHGVGFHQPSTWGARNAGAPSACVDCSTMATEATRHVVFQTVLLTLSPVAPAAAGQAQSNSLKEITL